MDERFGTEVVCTYILSIISGVISFTLGYFMAEGTFKALSFIGGIVVVIALISLGGICIGQVYILKQYKERMREKKPGNDGQ